MRTSAAVPPGARLSRRNSSSLLGSAARWSRRAAVSEGSDIHAEADLGGIDTFRCCNDFFFFAFDARLDGYSKRSGIEASPDTLEPVIWNLYEYAKAVTPARFMAAVSALNVARRKLARAARALEE